MATEVSAAERWNQRYRAGVARALPKPDPWALEFIRSYPAAQRARALDLAGGTGRHALEMAARGFKTELWDVSSVALQLASERAAELDLHITPREVNLEQRPLPDAQFDALVVVDYLDRGLLRDLPRLCAQGAHVCLVTFTDDYAGAHPSSRFRLRRGELQGGLAGFERVSFRESNGRACLIARAAVSEASREDPKVTQD